MGNFTFELYNVNYMLLYLFGVTKYKLDILSVR